MTVDWSARMWRAALAQAPDTLLRTEEAVQALPMAEDDARAWLASQPCTDIPGVYRWGDLQAAILGEDDGPVTSWTSAAEVLGVSTHTLARKRKRHDPNRRPYWTSPDDCRAWFGELGVELAAEPRRKRRSAPSKKTEPGPIPRFRDAAKGVTGR